MTISSHGVTHLSAGLTLLMVGALLFGGPLVWATPTGLNNIPTNDTAPPQTIVLQTLTNFGQDARSTYLFGFKMGVIENLEIGADWIRNAEPEQHPALQAKYTLDLGPEWPKLGGGVANVSAHRQRNGQAMPYVVGPYDAKLIRAHGGYNCQHNNFGFFAGVDRTLPVLRRDLTLRADYIQIDNRHHGITSVGGMYNLPPRPPHKESANILDAVLANVIVEGWYSRPSTGALEDYFTIKLNYVIEF